MYSTFAMVVPAIALEVLSLAAWAALVASAVGPWPGIACGLAIFVAARVAFSSPWLGWLPAPAAAGLDAADLARAALALVGPLALGAVATGRETSSA
jgi:hypothetical protein